MGPKHNCWHPQKLFLYLNQLSEKQRRGRRSFLVLSLLVAEGLMLSRSTGRLAEPREYLWLPSRAVCRLLKCHSTLTLPFLVCQNCLLELG